MGSRTRSTSLSSWRSLIPCVREELLPNIAVTTGEVDERRVKSHLEIVPETQVSEKQPVDDSGGLKDIKPMLAQEIEKLH